MEVGTTVPFHRRNDTNPTPPGLRLMVLSAAPTMDHRWGHRPPSQPAGPCRGVGRPAATLA